MENGLRDKFNTILHSVVRQYDLDRLIDDLKIRLISTNLFRLQ